MGDYSLEFLKPAEDLAAITPWLTQNNEGELAVDIYETDKAVFIKTAIAGVKPEDLKLSVFHDIVTIRGVRHDEQAQEENRRYLSQECHWGAFSRTIILPAEVKVDRAEAIFKNGILMIKLPKTSKEGKIKLRVEE